MLEGVARAYREQRPELDRSSAAIVAAIADAARLGAGGPATAAGPGAVGGPSTAAGGLPDRTVLDAAVAALERSFDPRHGGWGGAPKFPAPMTIEFLLRRSAAGADDGRALAMARRTLDAMADGGIHDQLGGGFHRYATDAIWLVPHFEQMLYDNAQLARVYVHAWQLTGERRYLDVAVGTLDYLARELLTDDGGFAASQDADTEGEEGATFVWTPSRGPRGARRPDAELFGAAYDVTDGGNWEGRTILRRVRSDDELATMTRTTTADAVAGAARRRPVRAPRARAPASAAGPRRQGPGRLERTRARGVRRRHRRPRGDR